MLRPWAIKSFRPFLPLLLALLPQIRPADGFGLGPSFANTIYQTLVCLIPLPNNQPINLDDVVRRSSPSMQYSVQSVLDGWNDFRDLLVMLQDPDTNEFLRSIIARRRDAPGATPRDKEAAQALIDMLLFLQSEEAAPLVEEMDRWQCMSPELPNSTAPNGTGNDTGNDIVEMPPPHLCNATGGYFCPKVTRTSDGFQCIREPAPCLPGFWCGGFDHPPKACPTGTYCPGYAYFDPPCDIDQLYCPITTTTTGPPPLDYGLPDVSQQRSALSDPLRRLAQAAGLPSEPMEAFESLLLSTGGSPSSLGLPKVLSDVSELLRAASGSGSLSAEQKKLRHFAAMKQEAIAGGEDALEMSDWIVSADDTNETNETDGDGAVGIPPAVRPYACPWSTSCFFPLQPFFCPQGFSCGPRIFNPGMCPAGSYCPYKEKRKPCPEGSYCPVLSSSPTECDWWSTCPPGSMYQNSIYEVFITVVPTYAAWMVFLWTGENWMFDTRGYGIIFCWIYFVVIAVWPENVFRLRVSEAPQFFLLFTTIMAYGLHVSRWLPACLQSIFDAGAILLILLVPMIGDLEKYDMWVVRYSYIAINLLTLICFMMLTSADTWLPALTPDAKLALLVSMFCVLSVCYHHFFGHPGMFKEGQVGQVLGDTLIQLLFVWLLYGVLHYCKSALFGLCGVESAAHRAQSSATTQTKTKHQQAPLAQAQEADSDEDEEFADARSRVTNMASNAEKGAATGPDASDSTTPSVPQYSPDARSVDFQLDKLDFKLNSGKRVLQGVSLDIQAGESVAILGSSGGGKSTLLNVLSGRCGYGYISGGSLEIGGMSETEARAKLGGLIGFVPQDDIVHTALTVRENILYQAQLRLAGKSVWEAGDHTDEVLSMLGIDHVKDSVIGDEHNRGVSGGQRKRVSVGMEFVAKPVVMFLDEPTTGLDSASAHVVMEVVCDYARTKHVTTIAVLHSPRWATLELFDKLVLMASGGVCVYGGHTKFAKDYFLKHFQLTMPKDMNPADMLLDTITYSFGQKLVEKQLLVGLDVDTPETYYGGLGSCWRGWQEKAHQRSQVVGRKGSISGQKAEIRWPQSTWSHFKRSFSLASRRRTEILMNSFFCGGSGMVSFLCFSFNQWDPGAYMINGGQLAILSACLTQGIIGFQAFSSDDIRVAAREGAVGVNMLHWFMAAQATHLLEIIPASLLWGTAVWFLSGSNALLYEIVSLGFALIFAHWGLAYLCAVMFSKVLGGIFIVIGTFVLMILSGMSPALPVLMEGPVAMNLIPMASPLRYSMGILYRLHFEGDGYNVDNLKQVYGGKIAYPGGALIQGNCPPVAPVYRWMEGDGMICSVEPLILIGITLRFVVAMIVMMQANVHANGGAFECKGRVRTGMLGVSIMTGISFFMKVFICFFFWIMIVWVAFMEEF